MSVLGVLFQVYCIGAAAVFLAFEAIGALEGCEEWDTQLDPRDGPTVRAVKRLPPFARFSIFAALTGLLWPFVVAALLASEEW